MRDFFNEFVPFIIISLLMLALVLGSILLAVNFLEEYKCEQYSEFTGKATKWAFMDECYIQVGDEWITKPERIKQVIAKDGLSHK